MYTTPFGDVLVIAYPVRVHELANRLKLDIRHGAEQMVEATAEQMVELYREEAMNVDANDSGDFIDTMASHETGDALYRIVKSGVRYAGVIEEGWIWRPQGQESYPGRWPAARAVDRAEEAVEAAATQTF